MRNAAAAIGVAGSRPSPGTSPIISQRYALSSVCPRSSTSEIGCAVDPASRANSAPQRESGARTLKSATKIARLFVFVREVMFGRRSSLFLEIAMRTMFREQRPEPPAERELTLCEMLDDPIVAHVMRRDGVVRSDVARLFTARPRERLCRTDRRTHRRRA